MKFEKLAKFKEFALVKKIMYECEKHLSIKEKWLAEYIIHLAKEAESVDEFRSKLIEGEAEFEDDTIYSIFQATCKLYPQSKRVGYRQGDTMTIATEQLEKSGLDLQSDRYRDLKERSKLSELFPSLAMPNLNKDELELDLNFDADNQTNTNTNRDKPAASIEKAKRSPRRSSNSSERNRNNRRRKRSYSRDSDSKERRHNSRRDTSKRDTDSRRDNDNRRERKRSRDSRSASAERRHRHSRNREHESQEALPKFGLIYKGEVRNVQEYGAFIAIDGFRRKEGLWHVSQIKIEGRLRNANDMLRISNKVFVKVMSVRDNKISLSMKEVDQVTGRDLNPLHTDELLSGDRGKILEPKEKSRRLNPTRPGGNDDRDRNLTGFGNDVDRHYHKHESITGIKPEVFSDLDKKDVTKKRLASPDLWEMTRLKGGQVLDKDDTLNMDGVVADNLDELDEEDNEIELNEERPPFLQFTKTKTGISLSPIRITKNPDGSLNRIAMKQGQISRERKDAREQKQKETKLKNEAGIKDASSTANLYCKVEEDDSKIFDIPEWKKKNDQKQRVRTKNKPDYQRTKRRSPDL